MLSDMDRAICSLECLSINQISCIKRRLKLLFKLLLKIKDAEHGSLTQSTQHRMGRDNTAS